MDFTNNRDVIAFINQTILKREVIKGKVISNSVLEEFYTETGNEFFKTLIAYRKSSDRYTKVTSFIKNVFDQDFDKDDKENVKAFIEKKKFGDIRISPIAKLNASGAISLSNPSLPFSMEDIKNLIVEYNVAIPCKDMEEVLYLLNKYGDLVIGDDYLVVGTTFYAEMMRNEDDGFPFPLPIEEELKHMQDFRTEFLGEKPEQEEKIEEKEEECPIAKQIAHAKQMEEKWNAMCQLLKAGNN